MTMRARRTSRLAWGLTFSLLLGPYGCSSVHVSPLFNARQASIRVIGALPPDVGVYRLSFKGDQELMPELLHTVARTIATASNETFTAKGYTIHQLDQDDAAFTADPQLRAALFNAQQVFAKRLAHLEKHRFWREFSYDVGPEVNQFADVMQSDVLLFSRCEAIKKTGGEIAKDLLKTALIFAATLGSALVYYYPSVTVLQFAVVDGDSGDILWYHSNIPSREVGFDVERTKKLHSMVSKLLKPFPKASPPAASARPTVVQPVSSPRRSAPAIAPPRAIPVPVPIRPPAVPHHVSSPRPQAPPVVTPAVPGQRPPAPIITTPAPAARLMPVTGSEAQQLKTLRRSPPSTASPIVVLHEVSSLDHVQSSGQAAPQ